jgi:transcriptional regulator with XRE-family HTH domain
MLATQLRVEIVRHGLSGYELNRRLGLSGDSGYMNQIARGERTVNRELALKIAQNLGVPMLSIWHREGEGRWRATTAQKRDGVSGASNSK